MKIKYVVHEYEDGCYICKRGSYDTVVEAIKQHSYLIYTEGESVFDFTIEVEYEVEE